MKLPLPAVLLAGLAAMLLTGNLKVPKLFSPAAPAAEQQPWQSPYTTPANPNDPQLVAIRNAVNSENRTGAEMMSSLMQIYADMIRRDNTNAVMKVNSDIRRAFDYMRNLLPGEKIKLPQSLFNQGTSPGLVEQYVRAKVPNATTPGDLTPERRAQYARAYEDVAWTLAQASSS